MAIVAVEPMREVADWLRRKGESLGLDLEVFGDFARAEDRLRDDEIRIIAGYFDGVAGRLPHRPGAKGPKIIPFYPYTEESEDHCDRWRLLLRAVRGRLIPVREKELERLGLWIDARFEEEMESRHRALIARLSPIFRELTRRDPSIREHSFRVGVYAARIGEALDLTPLDIRLLHLGGWVHDVGKIRVAADILKKTGMLGPEERADMHGHPVWGSRIVMAHPAEEEILGMIRHHHERFDGKGYPAGLAGEDIPILARILAVADAYDAITSDRPYRLAAGHREALREILACSGTQFDPIIVRALLVSRLDRASVAISAA